MNRKLTESDGKQGGLNISPTNQWSLLRLITENSADLLSIEDGYDEFIYASPSSMQLFGWSEQELCNRSLYALLHADDVQRVAEVRAALKEHREVRVRFRLRCRSGEYRWVESRSRNSDEWPYVVTLTRDIHNETKKLQELERLASYDALPKLPNRRALDSALHSELQRSRRHGLTLSIAFFDIDGFKCTNDECGHQAGDDLLQAVSRCAERNKRAYDTLGRWGGDEFRFLFPKTTLAEAGEVTRRCTKRSVAAATALH